MMQKREFLKRKTLNFYWLTAFFAILAFGGDVFAAQQPNPRSVSMGVSSPRLDAKVVSRGSGNSAVVDGVARSTVVRNTSSVNRNMGRSAVRGNAGAVVSRAATSANARDGATMARSTANTIARSVMPTNLSRGRSATNISHNGLARAATKARATAVFTDVSKIGGGYSKCREAYATCMDQFCANANDTYRRCYCSARFTEFRDTELALDQAKTLLMQFEDNNLNVVDKSASEVNAMYTATVGEAAIKNDTSGAQSILNEIGDLLSGKKKSSTPENSNASMGIISIDFSTDMDDVWGSDGGSSIFDTNTGVDLTALEGIDLYNASNKQCLELIKENCESNAVLTMATSAYGIMITQDCNIYEKKIASQREAVKQTVRQAEKYLREARLEEYRAHNSADVNECVAKVKTAMLTDAACGANYKRCLDPSGVYINQTNGEPIYSQRLFKMADLIGLDGTSDDVLGQNPEFDKFLNSKRMFATSALDTCRDMSDIVWNEFKRTALIEIAQAQDEKIEEVKMSCVSTMAECYDTQSGALRDFDTTTAKTSGALSAYAARALCQDKVIACASLYGNTEGCKFDNNGKLTSGNAKDGSARCGLTALLAFVDTVDDVRVAEGCESALETYLTDMCTPASGDIGYPWNCRGMSEATIKESIDKYAKTVCADPDTGAYPDTVKQQIDDSIEAVVAQLDYQMMEQCEALDGYWQPAYWGGVSRNDDVLLDAFYNNAFGGNRGDAQTIHGKCVENTTRVQCLANNSEESVRAKYDANTDTCTFTEEWYREKCQGIGGYYEDATCYIGQSSIKESNKKVTGEQ
ncbi:MAG: hypothetical protein J6K82_03795 [Alphaproteobacteria bacterium]|nr:hypothetical protein [Alphaproteobacteria bacterium]